MFRSLTISTAFVLGLSFATNARAQTSLDTVRVASGLAAPVLVTAPPNDFARVFIVQQGGKIRILSGGSLLATPFLDLSAKVNFSGEQGLLGLAFDPNYAANGYFYVDYARAGDGYSMIERYTVSANPDVADPTTATTILGPWVHPQNNHNGGCLQFGSDGMLYGAWGDGGNANDTGPGHTAATGNAQDPSQLLGKMLRLDVNNPPTYIPANNPFVNTPGYQAAIWDLGMRNPWRWSFDRLTGEMYIGDVGQSAREEVDIEAPVSGGHNYGWRCMEGTKCTGFTGCTCNDVSLTLPIYDYAHTSGNCAIIGGFVYRGSICDLQGTYFFADYCSARIWSFRYVGGQMTEFTDRTTELAPGGGLKINNISGFGEDAAGELYICDIGDGEIYKIVPGAITDCNQNGVSDLCDISSGTSLDANGDDIPDECQCPNPPANYCTAKVNSLFCSPAMSFTGVPNVSTSVAFNLHADQVLNKKFGLLFYGLGPNGAPFEGGTLCVQLPIKRTTVQSSGGSATGSDCTGTFDYNFKPLLLSGSDPSLVVGASVYAQFWYRDPGFSPPDNTGLTDAVSFSICN